MFNLFKKNDNTSHTTPPVPEPEVSVAAPSLTWAQRLKNGLAKTGSNIASVFSSGNIDEALYEELETLLLTADCGINATQALLEDVRLQVDRSALKDASQLRGALQNAMTTLLSPLQQPLDTAPHHPFVIMLVGVNGAGKTTTIGKLVKRLQTEGKSVLIAAGDTFRAAAREQLQTWGERNQVHVVMQEGGDPAAVIFDAVNSAIAKNIDVVIADTAGRLPTQQHLMEEIKKVQRVIAKALPDAPHEVLLVLDANTGQNAIAQVKAFHEALKVTGLVLTKLDGSAKGGVIAAIARTQPIPVRFIGVGEQIDDLQPFNAAEFSEALFS
ncbi:MAG TPA: signal recognition particle-docking protein FtsY [Methylophilaceae bacterium]|jgi:fused signal recognition particle receptor